MITQLWPTLLLDMHDHNLIKYRERLIHEFQKIKATHENLQSSRGNVMLTTVNGYQPDYDILSDEPQLKAELLDLLAKAYWKQFIKDAPNAPSDVKFEHKTWFVEYEKGSYQNLHMHKQSTFTSVWFLQVDEQTPGAGELQLRNPNVASYLMGVDSEYHQVVPSTGRMVTFPSWLQHNVTPASGTRLVFVWDTTVYPVQYNSTTR